LFFKNATGVWDWRRESGLTRNGFLWVLLLFQMETDVNSDVEKWL